MSDNPSDHAIDITDAKHVSDAGMDGGSCCGKGCPTGSASHPQPTIRLARPVDNSCNYRCQAIAAYRTKPHPLGRKNYYDTALLPASATQPVRTSREETKKSKEARAKNPKLPQVFNPAIYSSGSPSFVYPSHLPPPDRENRTWDIDGPVRDWTWEDHGSGAVLMEVKAGTNFQHVFLPWWNNAHHLIPQSTMKTELKTIANPPGWNPALSISISELVEKTLLTLRYNLNHHVNMILLPQDEEVGALLGLPRHLVLADEASKEETADVRCFTDHETYRDRVAEKLREVFRGFAEKAETEDGKCVSAKMRAAKDELEQLSKTLYRKLTSNEGKSKKWVIAPGKPISTLPPL